MNIHKFEFSEMFSDSKGKTSMSLTCALIVVITGCVMGIKGAFSGNGEAMINGLGFIGVGGGLLGIRRFTKDQPVSAEADKPKVE